MLRNMETTTTLDAKAVGRRIRDLRRKRGISQEELGSPRYSHAYISHLERGTRRPSGEALGHIAARLDVSVEQLETGRDPHLDIQLQLDVDRAIAEIHSGHLDEAAAKIEAVRKRARKEGFTEASAVAEEALALVAQRKGLWEEALAHVDAAEALLAGQPAERRTSLVTTRARCLFASNDLNHAIHILERHLVELNQHGSGDPTALLQTYSALVGPYWEAGFKDRAAAIAEEGFRLETRVQDPEHVACMHINRAQILLEQGHKGEAMRSLSRAEDLFKQIGWRDSAVKAAVAQAVAALEHGDLEEAETRAHNALAEISASPSVLDQVRILNLLARIARVREQPRLALKYLDEASELLGDSESLEQGWRFRETGLCYLDLEQPDPAVKALRAALQIYREASSPAQVATTAAYLGDALTRLGHHDEAGEVYRSGLAEIEDLTL